MVQPIGGEVLKFKREECHSDFSRDFGKFRSSLGVALRTITSVQMFRDSFKNNKKLVE
jgi:hypothetical protein